MADKSDDPIWTRVAALAMADADEVDAQTKSLTTPQILSHLPKEFRLRCDPGRVAYTTHGATDPIVVFNAANEEEPRPHKCSLRACEVKPVGYSSNESHLQLPLAYNHPLIDDLNDWSVLSAANADMFTVHDHSFIHSPIAVDHLAARRGRQVGGAARPAATVRGRLRVHALRQHAPPRPRRRRTARAHEARRRRADAHPLQGHLAVEVARE